MILFTYYMLACYLRVANMYVASDRCAEPEVRPFGAGTEREGRRSVGAMIVVRRDLSGSGKCRTWWNGLSNDTTPTWR